MLFARHELVKRQIGWQARRSTSIVPPQEALAVNYLYTLRRLQLQSTSLTLAMSTLQAAEGTNVW